MLANRQRRRQIEREITRWLSRSKLHAPPNERARALHKPTRAEQKHRKRQHTTLSMRGWQQPEQRSGKEDHSPHQRFSSRLYEEVRTTPSSLVRAATPKRQSKLSLRCRWASWSCCQWHTAIASPGDYMQPNRKQMRL